MISELLPVVTTVVGVFLVILIGATCRKRDWLTPQADRTMASLTANVMLPAYFMNTILGSDQFDSLSSAWQPPLYGFAFAVIGFAIGYGFAKAVGPWIGLDHPSKQTAFALCVGVCNYGYVPLPLAEKFYPEAMIELILHNVGVELALWSVGVALISSGVSGQWKRAFLSAPFLAVVFALLLRMLGGHQFIPPFISWAISTLGACAIPLGLLLSGAIMVDFLSSAKWGGSMNVILGAIGIRQVIMPILMLGTTWYLAPSTDMQHVMLLQAAMPVAVFPIVIVRLYERDTQTAIMVIVSTSVAGLITIPFWLSVGRLFLGA